MRFGKLASSVTMSIGALLLAMAVQPANLAAQGLELNGGYTHVTQDFGLDGFEVGAGWRFNPQVGLYANYDDTYDTSRIGIFEFTTVGAITAKSHLQDFMVGPRYYFAYQTIHKHTIVPFAEVQFGVSHLNSKIQQGTLPFVENSDSAFSWLIGGGADYDWSPHWSARANLGLLRTHLNDTGQSRLRFALGVSYSFGSR